MTIKIYHNARCRKSREALALIEESGHKPEIIEYLKVPLHAQDIEDLLVMMDKEPQDIMRKNEKTYKDMGLKNVNLSREALINILVENPILIERPIIVSGSKALIARPPELVKDIL